MTQDHREWGPLESLIGSWSGLRQDRLTSGGVAESFEVRTFERRPPMPNVGGRHWNYPLIYSVIAFDSEECNEQLYEEHGYWLWVPTAQRVFQLAMTPSGLCILTVGDVENPQADYYRLNLSVSNTHSSENALYAELADSIPPKSVQVNYQFTSHAFSYEQTVLFEKNDNEIPCCSTGELRKVERPLGSFRHRFDRSHDKQTMR